MAEATKIEWCDSTFNPWVGCTKVGPGCDHCYADGWAKRSGTVQWGPHAERRRTTPANWRTPLQWDAQHAEFFAVHGRRQRVFCASLADVFDNAVPPEWRRDLFELIGRTQHLDWLLLTKRIGNARAMLNAVVEEMSCGINTWDERPWPGVWIGATVVNQQEADRDVPKLLQVPARVRFLSVEPMLGPMDLTRIDTGGGDFEIYPLKGTTDCYDHDGPIPDIPAIDWVICGGESGPGARPMHPDWARSLREQCASAGVPFLFKQWGEHDLSYDRDRDDPDYRRCDAVGRLPGRWINSAGGHGFNGERVHYAHRIGKRAAGRLLDGVEHNGFPEVRNG